MARQLTIEQKIGLFKMLASKTLYEVGIEYGFDKHYKDASSIKGAVYRNYADVKNNPEKYGISKDTYDLVVDAVTSRAVSNVRPEMKAKEKEDLEKADINELVLSNRDKISRLMAQKLDMITKSELKKMSLKEFGTLFGILFDKGQIVQGQSTKNIAVLSKIEDGLSSKELLDAVISQREHTVTKS